MKTSNTVLFSAMLAIVIIAFGASYSVISKKPNSVIASNSDDKSISFSVKLPTELTREQAEVLSLAYSIAKKDGHKFPQLLQGIVMQESNAGAARSYKVAGQEFGLKTNERYYGVSQIKLVAAKEVLSRYPELRKDFNFHTKEDEEIVAKLIEDNRFNISVASKYLLVLKSLGYDTIKHLALAYNQGPSGAKNHDAETHHYPKGVINNIQKISKN